MAKVFSSDSLIASHARSTARDLKRSAGARECVSVVEFAVCAEGCFDGCRERDQRASDQKCMAPRGMLRAL